MRQVSILGAKPYATDLMSKEKEGEAILQAYIDNSSKQVSHTRVLLTELAGRGNRKTVFTIAEDLTDCTTPIIKMPYGRPQKIRDSLGDSPSTYNFPFLVGRCHVCWISRSSRIICVHVILISI